MRNVNFIFLIIILSISLSVAAQETKTEISVFSNPDNAKVLLNGVFKGRTPLTIEVDKDTYELTVQKSGFVTWKTQFSLVGDRISHVANLEPKEGLTYISNIPDEHIWSTTGDILRLRISQRATDNTRWFNLNIETGLIRESPESFGYLMEGAELRNDLDIRNPKFEAYLSPSGEYVLYLDPLVPQVTETVFPQRILADFSLYDVVNNTENEIENMPRLGERVGRNIDPLFIPIWSPDEDFIYVQRNSNGVSGNMFIATETGEAYYIEDFVDSEGVEHTISQFLSEPTDTGGIIVRSESRAWFVNILEGEGKVLPFDAVWDATFSTGGDYIYVININGYYMINKDSMIIEKTRETILSEGWNIHTVSLSPGGRHALIIEEPIWDALTRNVWLYELPVMN